MIANEQSSNADPALRWAASELGVPPDSPPEARTAAFLRRLADEDFVPPERLRQAWEYVATKPDARPALPWIDDGSEDNLGAQIEKFAAGYFDLPLDQRQRNWQYLGAQAARWPRLANRMRQLKPGLAITFTPLPTMSLREAKLVKWIRELFPLPPDRRAERRRELMRGEESGDIRLWEKAAQQLRRKQPDIARLAPDLVVPLASWSKQVSAGRKNRMYRGGVRVVTSGRRPLFGGSKVPVRLAVFAAVAITCLSQLFVEHSPNINYHPTSNPSNSIDTRGLEREFETLKEKGVDPETLRPYVTPPAPVTIPSPPAPTMPFDPLKLSPTPSETPATPPPQVAPKHE